MKLQQDARRSSIFFRSNFILVILDFYLRIPIAFVGNRTFARNRVAQVWHHIG